MVTAVADIGWAGGIDCSIVSGGASPFLLLWPVDAGALHHAAEAQERYALQE